jgi:hypothetical protein
MKRRLLFSALVCASLTLGIAAAQQSAAPAVVTASRAVPSLINYTGVLKDIGGRMPNSVTGVTFLLYKEEQGGAPLWLETQNVTPDKTGHYTVQLGATSAKGLPADLFVSGQGRWLAVQIVSEAEQPRALLVAVPYAMKAVDAETVGGLPASAFVLAVPPSSGIPNSAGGAPAGSFTNQASSSVTTTGGVVNTLPLWTTGTNIQSSVVTQSGTKIGINTTTPSATLDVKGGETLRGLFYLTTSGTATASGGKNSYPFDIVATSFNSTTSTSLNQTFQWLTEPVGNNTPNPSGTLNLLYGLGATAPSETGLKISHTGVFTFAPGQSFPGTGTVTSVGSGAGLTGGPITSSGTLSIATAGVTNAMLVHPSLTVTAGTDLTGGGAVALGAATTLNLDITKVPQLGSANLFTQSQSVKVGVGTFTNTQMNQYLSSFVNGISTHLYHDVGYPGFATEAITGGMAVPSTAGIEQANGLAGYTTTACDSGGRINCNAVGVFTYALTTGNGAAAWGANPVVSDSASVSSNLTGIEVDTGVGGTPTYVRGQLIALSSTHGLIGTMPSTSATCAGGNCGSEALEIGSAAVGSLAWGKGIVLDDGSFNSANNALEIGATDPVIASQPSYKACFARLDGGGSRHVDVCMNSSITGDLVLAASAGGTVRLPTALLFASLPSCVAGIEGAMRPVSDSTTATWGATIGGSGGNHVLAYCDGTNWTVMAK